MMIEFENEIDNLKNFLEERKDKTERQLVIKSDL